MIRGEREDDMIRKLTIGTAIFLAATLPAFAHIDPQEHGSLAAGFSHPLFGIDHVLAMAAVGLWAAMLASGRGDNRHALWLVPAAFVAAMTAGFGAALLDLPLPFVEPVILASVVVIGLLAAMAFSMPTPMATALVGFFAFFHGHAHGGELGTASAIDFGIGFAAGTVLLHSVGIALGLGLGRLSGGKAAPRIAGALAALAGAWLAIG
jgi:urease accessory protein